MRIKLPFKLSITRIFANKKFAVFFSLFLSFAIWLSVMINQNPIRERVFTDISATVSIEGTTAEEKELGIVSDYSSQKFTVTVSGPNYIVSSLTSDDFILSADVSGVDSQGTHTLTVSGSANSSKSGYTFKSITPNTLDVKFDYIDSKEFTVTPKLVGVSVAEGLVAEAPVTASNKQSVLVVKGPRSSVENIASAVAYAEVNKTLSETQTFDSHVILCNEQGETLYEFRADGSVVDAYGSVVTDSYLSLSYKNDKTAQPTTIKITQPISKKAVLPVKASFANLPEGIAEAKVSYKVNHSKVTVIGTPDIVDSMDAVYLETIDFNTVTPGNSTFDNLTPTLKYGVKLFDSIEDFTVEIDTSLYAEKTFTVSKIEFTGIDSSLIKSGDSSIKNVKICGPKDVIAAIKPADLYAVADLSDKTTGEHSVSVTVKSGKYDTIWQIGSYNVTVTIK